MSISSNRILKSISQRANSGRGGPDGDDFFGEKISIVEIILSGQIELLVEALGREPERVNETCPRYRVTPIMAACGKNMLKASSILLSIDGLDLFKRDFAGRTAMEHAAPFPKMLTVLLDYCGYAENWPESAP